MGFTFKQKKMFFQKGLYNVLCHQLKLVVSGLILIGLDMSIAEGFGAVKFKKRRNFYYNLSSGILI